jgi:hypothetical protein
MTAGAHPGTKTFSHVACPAPGSSLVRSLHKSLTTRALPSGNKMPNPLRQENVSLLRHIPSVELKKVVKRGTTLEMVEYLHWCP